MSRISTIPSPRSRAAYTLIELIIVIAILAAVAVLTAPQFGMASEQARDSAITTQLRRVRGQIDLYRVREAADPDLIASQWVDMVSGEYLKQAPRNPLNASTTVAAAPAAGVGWVWRDRGNGTFGLFATDATGAVELVE